MEMTQQSVFGAECNMGRRGHSAALRARGSRPSRPLVCGQLHIFMPAGIKAGKGWRERERGERDKKKNKCRKSP